MKTGARHVLRNFEECTSQSTEKDSRTAPISAQQGYIAISDGAPQMPITKWNNFTSESSIPSQIQTYTPWTMLRPLTVWMSPVRTSVPPPQRVNTRCISSKYTTSHDPLRPSVPTDNLGLPLEPQPVPIPCTNSTAITSADLARLHRLSALDPPANGSEEEARLLRGLNELVGLMEEVKSVKLPTGQEALGELLTQGVGEITIGEHTGQQRDEGQVRGQALLGWATSRKGDYYHSKAGKKQG